jgi:hypothetical protein
MRLKVTFQSIRLLLHYDLFINPVPAEVKFGENADRGLDRVFVLLLRRLGVAARSRSGIASVAGLE